MADKSYFYVFLEDPYDRDKMIRTVFDTFHGRHDYDSEVEIFVPGTANFDKGRKAFNIGRLPAFAVSDAPATFQGSANPSFAMERGVLDMYGTEEQLYRFISDLHYMVRDEEILRVRLNVAKARVEFLLKGVWQEVKDFVTINIAR